MGYRRSQERNRRLEKLYEKTKHGYSAGAYYDRDKGRYVRYSCHNKFLRKLSRKRIRNAEKTDAPSRQKGRYKRLYDYWWNLL